MMDELELTQEQVAENMGKDRSTVTNYIRLLSYHPISRSQSGMVN